MSTGSAGRQAGLFPRSGGAAMIARSLCRKLYSVKGTNMYVQELDGRFRRTLYRDVFKLPRALAIHAPLGYGFGS